MRLKKWFSRRRDDAESDPLVDFRLGAMKVGYLVDYDMKTWEVKGYNTYEYSGFETKEWVLETSDQIVYLERDDSDGKTIWTLTASISISQISGDVVEHTLRHEDPPENLIHDGRSYKLMGERRRVCSAKTPRARVRSSSVGPTVMSQEEMCCS